MTYDSDPPHMENFAIKVPVGEFVSEEEGVSNKLSKKDASIDVPEEEKELPTLSVAERVKPQARKKAGFTGKWQAEDAQWTSEGLMAAS